jgi:hypothetical protein
MLLLKPSGIELPPGTGEGHSGHSASILGRRSKDWEHHYVPTTGHDATKGRYPPNVTKEPDNSNEAAKQSTQILAHGHAASYLIELPRDDVEQKAGLIAASVLYDIVFGRDSDPQ